MFIGDDQRRKAMTPTLTPPAGTVAGPAADERCDRCSAAGKLRLTLAGGSELVFCGHHANRYAEDLVKITFFTTDGSPEALKLSREIRARKLGDLAPSSTFLVIAGLAGPDLKVEIEGEAVGAA